MQASLDCNGFGARDKTKLLAVIGLYKSKMPPNQAGGTFGRGSHRRRKLPVRVRGALAIFEESIMKHFHSEGFDRLRPATDHFINPAAKDKSGCDSVVPFPSPIVPGSNPAEISGLADDIDNPLGAGGMLRDPFAVDRRQYVHQFRVRIFH